MQIFGVMLARGLSDKRKRAQENERPAGTLQTKKAGQGFWNKFINGHIRLPIMFWGYGIMVSCILKTLVKVKEIEEFLAYIYIYYDMLGLKIVLVTYDAILILYTILVCIGSWRSADNYTGRPIWAIAVKFFVMLWSLSLVIAIGDIVNIILMKDPGAAG